MSRAALTSLGVFAILLVLVLVTREDRVSVGLRTLELPSVAAEDVTRIAIGGANSALLQRADGDSWSVEDPALPGVRFPVESSHIERLLSAIGELELGSFVTGRPESHVELEIDDAKGTTLEVSADGAVVLDLVLGRRAKSGGDLVRVRDSDAVFAAQGALAAAARRSVEDWRRHQIVAAEAGAIATLRVTPAAGSDYTLARGEGEGAGFRLADGTPLPPGFALDSAAAGRVATGLVALRADAFVDDDPGEGSTGLGDSAARVEALDASGNALLAVRFGATDGERRVYVRVDGEPQIYQVSEARAAQVAPPLAKLRDLTLLSADPAQLSGLMIQRGEEHTELSKQSGAWQLVQPDPPPEGYEFDPKVVDGRMSALTRMRGSRFLGVAGEVDADFSDAVDLQLRFADGSTRQLRFGGPVEAGEGNVGEEIAVDPGNGFVYAVRAFERRRYEKPLDLFEYVEPPPAPPGAGGIQGLEGLPPDVRRQIEQQLRQQQGAR